MPCAEPCVLPPQPTWSRGLLQQVMQAQLKFCHFLRAKYSPFASKSYLHLSSTSLQPGSMGKPGYEALKWWGGVKSEGFNWGATEDAFKWFTNLRCFMIWLIGVQLPIFPRWTVCLIVYSVRKTITKRKGDLQELGLIHTVHFFH